MKTARVQLRLRGEWTERLTITLPVELLTRIERVAAGALSPWIREQLAMAAGKKLGLQVIDDAELPRWIKQAAAAAEGRHTVSSWAEMMLEKAVQDGTQLEKLKHERHKRTRARSKYAG